MARIAPSRPEEYDALLALYPQAFPDEDLTALVQALLDTPEVLSLTGWRDDQIAGHALFTRCTVTGAAGTVALLGPLCVAPDAQRQGLGGALIEEGAQHLASEAVCALLVLGDPQYYSRHGFSAPSPVQRPMRCRLNGARRGGSGRSRQPLRPPGSCEFPPPGVIPTCGARSPGKSDGAF